MQPEVRGKRILLVCFWFEVELQARWVKRSSNYCSFCESSSVLERWSARFLSTRARMVTRTWERGPFRAETDVVEAMRPPGLAQLRRPVYCEPRDQAASARMLKRPRLPRGGVKRRLSRLYLTPNVFQSCMISSRQKKRLFPRPISACDVPFGKINEHGFLLNLGRPQGRRFLYPPYL